jgi:hypothetical protein
MEMVGQYHAPTALHPGISRYPLCRRQVESQARYGRVKEMSRLQGSDNQTVRLIASMYTDRATQ